MSAPGTKTSLYLRDDMRAELAARGNMSEAADTHLRRYFDMLAEGRKQLRSMFSTIEVGLLPKITANWDMLGLRYSQDGLGCERAVRDALADDPTVVDAAYLSERIVKMGQPERLALQDAYERWQRAAAAGMPVEFSLEG